MTYISVTARRSLSAYDGYILYVSIVAAFHNADYFAFRINYCFGEKRKNNVFNKNLAPATNVIVLFFFYLKQKSFFKV